MFLIDIIVMLLTAVFGCIAAYVLIFKAQVRYALAGGLLLIFSYFKFAKIWDRVNGDPANFADFGEAFTNLALIIMALIYVRHVNK